MNEIDDKSELELRNELSDRFIYYKILYALNVGEITEKDTLKHIRETLFNYETVQKTSDELLFVTYHIDSIKESVNLELENGYYYQAAILAITCIEHILNSFYKDYFTFELKLSETEIEKMLGVSMKDKTGVLFKIVFRQDFPDDLKSSIIDLNKIRNKFVHYKFKGITLDELDNDYLNEKKVETRILQSVDLITKLEAYLDKFQREINHNIKIAENIYHRIIIKEN